MGKRKNLIINLFVLLYFSLATIIVTYPLIFHLKDFVFGLGDELLITWIINWDIHSFTHNILNIYNANTLHPFSGVLTFSDAFFTSAIIGFIPYLITRSPLTSYNVNVLLAIITYGYFTYLYVKKLSNNSLSGIISGTIVVFSVYNVIRYFHLQLISIQWIPITLLLFIIYTEKRKIKYLIGCSVCIILQAANSFFPVYLLSAILVIHFVYYYFRNRNILFLFKGRSVLVLSVVTLSFIFLLGLPYLITSNRFHYVRDIRDTINFANRPEYFLYPNERTKLGTLLVNTFYKNDTNLLKHDGFLGFVLYAAGCFSVIYVFIKRKKLKNKNFFIYTITCAVAYILSLGPALQWKDHVIKQPFIIPLPYVVLYYLLPGFKGFRNSARWEMLVVFSLAVLIGLVFSEITKKKSTIFKLAFTWIICTLVFFEIKLPIKYEKMPLPSQYPPVYEYLSSLPDTSAIVEFPIFNWNMTPYSMIEFTRLIYSTKHYKNMVNGASGFYPPEWEKRTQELYFQFPNPLTIRYLKDIHISYIIIHADEYNVLYKNNYIVQGKKSCSWNTMKNALDSYKELIFIKKFGNDYVYKLQ